MASSVTKLIQPPEVTQRIIQCPDCQTKFAVPQSTIASIEFPRFHCSRCDHVFSLEEEKQARGNTAAEIARLFPRIEAEPKPASQLDLTAAAQPAARIIEPEEVDDLMLEPARTTPQPQPTFQIPQYEGHVEMSAPHESGDEDPAEQMSIDFAAAASEPILPHVPTIERRSEPMVDAPAPKISTLSASHRLRAETEMNEPLPTHIPSAIPAPAIDDGGLTTAVLAKQLARERSRARWNSFLTLAVPAMAFLFILFIASFWVRAAAAREGSVVSGLLPSAAHVAPQDLAVSDVHYRRIVLDNGEVARVIGGVVTNKTASVFKEMDIEVALFDANGQQIDKRIVKSSPTLARTRLKSLSLDMIKNLQAGAGKGADRFMLKPGEKMEFVIPVFDVENAASSRFYAARVYSVR